ncbi:MAG TPA: hypothetical protein DHV36_20195 [Desulfobacteraceae bacterium]|nr:hypothetical protein [Desulfobacteraceae bacterium]
MKKLLFRISLGLIAVIFLLLAIFHRPLYRAYRVATLFDEAQIAENFRSMDTIFDKAVMNKGNPHFALAKAPRPITDTYLWQGREKSISAFLKENSTTGLLVIKDGVIVHEAYFQGNTKDSKVIAWSVSKSLLSAVFGIAVHEGFIDIEKNVAHYVPYLKESGYEKVRIKDVLQMSSGIRFDETYSDPDSDINRMGRSLALNTSIDAFVKSLKNERPPGTYNHYVSMDTQVLGMILREATGEPVGAYMERKLWQPLGTDADAYWLTDNEGMELVFGGLNATARDYARFGLLYLNNGKLNNRQIVPEAWVKASITPDAPHLMPGRREPGKDYPLRGYGYQWWIPPGGNGDYSAIGIYNQYIYINPELKVVIVKNTAYADYNKDGNEKSRENIAVLRAIANALE